MSFDRAKFGDRQADMTARWFENVKRTHGDVDAYIKTRHDAYLGRWKEAGRFIDNGANILDIGGGNLFDRLISYFRDRELRYNYLDVDPSAVDGSRALAEQHGLTGATFSHGFNDQLNFADNQFDAVFSSHCIEHSIDLSTTFRELNRVIRPGGNLLMAVPFGWEMNPEHPYFLGPAEWVSLVEDAGFAVRVAQIGNEYPESGEDYFIAARKIGSPVENPRIIAMDFLKNSFTFVPFDDATVNCDGRFDRRDDCIISADSEAMVRIMLPKGAREVLPILHHHAWSSIVRISTKNKSYDTNLYSWFSYDMPEWLPFSVPSEYYLEITCVGPHKCSRLSQYVFKGYLWR